VTPISPVHPATTESAGLTAQQQHKLDEATRQFEAMLLKRVLASLEKTTQIGNQKSAGSSQYGGMLVEALADAIAQAGGLGLSRELSVAAAQARGATNEKTSK